MGFFKNISTLTRQAREMERTFDMGATMAQASQAMTQAQQYMAASMPVVLSPVDEARRTFTTATVTAAQETPMTIGMNVMVDLELIVQLPGGVPLPVRRIEQLSPLHLARVAPGSRLEVSLIPGMPESLRIEWGA